MMSTPTPIARRPKPPGTRSRSTTFKAVDKGLAPPADLSDTSYLTADEDPCIWTSAAEAATSSDERGTARLREAKVVVCAGRVDTGFSGARVVSPRILRHRPASMRADSDLTAGPSPPPPYANGCLSPALMPATDDSPTESSSRSEGATAMNRLSMFSIEASAVERLLDDEGGRTPPRISTPQRIPADQAEAEPHPSQEAFYHKYRELQARVKQKEQELIDAARAAEHALRGYEQLVTQLPTPLKPGMPQLLSSSPILPDPGHRGTTPVSIRNRTRPDRSERTDRNSATSSHRRRERFRVRTPVNDHDSSDMGESSRTPIRTRLRSKRHLRISNMSPRAQEALEAERDELHERAAELQSELSEARQDEERQRNLTGRLRKDIQRLEKQVETLEEELERQNDRSRIDSIPRGGRQQRRRRLQVGPRGKMMSRDHSIQQLDRRSSHSGSAYSSDSADMDSGAVLTSPTPRRSSFAHSEVSVVSSQLPTIDAFSAGDASSDAEESLANSALVDVSPSSSTGSSGRSIASFFASQTPSPAFRALATKLSLMRKRLSANLEDGPVPRSLAAEMGDAVAADGDAPSGHFDAQQDRHSGHAAVASRAEAERTPDRLSRCNRPTSNPASRRHLESDDAETSSDGAEPFCSPAPLPRGVSLALSVMANTFHPSLPQGPAHSAGRHSTEGALDCARFEGSGVGVHVKWPERRRSAALASARVTYAPADRRPRLSAPGRLVPNLAKGSPYPSASLRSARATLGYRLHGLPIPDSAITGRPVSMLRPEMSRLTSTSSTTSTIALAHRRVTPTDSKSDSSISIAEIKISPPAVALQVVRVQGPLTIGGRLVHDLITWFAIILEWIEFGVIIIIKVFLEARYGKSKTPTALHALATRDRHYF